MNFKRIFVTGIGTGVGKTLISAILTEAFEADYWKPVQAGLEEGTDAFSIRELISNPKSFIHPETYLLKLSASPHIAAREENKNISLPEIKANMPNSEKTLIIEGAGGLMVPLNENEFVADLVLTLQAPVILVSRNYLGSINHSMLTAMACRQKGIPVIGWIFNDEYMDYEQDIVRWSGIPSLAHIPYRENSGKEFVLQQAEIIRKLSENWSC